MAEIVAANEQIKSEHWTRGGSGLTNFGPEQFGLYRAAVAKYGDDRFVVSEERMIGMGENSEGGSLHFMGKARTAVDQMALTSFWKVFNDLRSAGLTVSAS